MYYKPYSNPEGTGWLGWIETKKGEALAFVRHSGEIIWNW
jgi:hypothetical protein